MGNGWDACKATACTNPVGVVPFRASLADQDSIGGKHRRSCETVPPVEPNPPRTMVAGSVVEQEGQGVVIAVELRGAVQANYENSVSHYKATLSRWQRVRRPSHT